MSLYNVFKEQIEKERRLVVNELAKIYYGVNFDDLDLDTQKKIKNIYRS